MPSWMVQIETTYQCDPEIISPSCKADLHGVGFLIYIPPSAQLKEKAHYLVMTDAHLSHGNSGPNSLRLSYQYNNTWHPLNQVMDKDQLKRLSDNLHDIDVIEVEKPKEISTESMFHLNYNEQSPSDSYFWVKDDTANKGFNEVYVAKNIFVIAPPNLKNKPEAYQQNKKYYSEGASLSEIYRTQQETTSGLNVASFGQEYITQSQIVGGMSGSPLLKRVTGRLVVLGLSKRYHRYFNLSYFSTRHQLSELLFNFGQRYYSSNPQQNQKADSLSWSFVPFVGTFTRDKARGVSEISQISLNSGTFDISNSGGHDSADGGGGHDTSDGGDWDTKVRAKINGTGMTFKHDAILGFKMVVPSLSDGFNSIPETVFNIYGNFEAINFMGAMKYFLQDHYGETIQYKTIGMTEDLIELFKAKTKNFPELTDPLKMEEELQKFNYYKNSHQKDLLDNYGQETDGTKKLRGGVPLCLINKASIDLLDEKDDKAGKSSTKTLEMALLRTSQIDHTQFSNVLKAYHYMEVPLDLSWKKGVVNSSVEVVLDPKGLFFVNVADPICSSVNCEFLFSLNKTPYVNLKWKEDSESKIANCFVLDDEDFFETVKSKSLKSEAL
ncbi:MAG: hypothetical protein ACXVCY_02045 [Pseudobdellovibrionaceae bacterium]